MLELLQWPAMAVTVLSSWLVASTSEARRCTGFWVFLLSNVLWIAWAVPAQAYALVVLQLFLAATNVRGIVKCRRDDRARAR